MGNHGRCWPKSRLPAVRWTYPGDLTRQCCGHLLVGSGTDSERQSGGAGSSGLSVCCLLTLVTVWLAGSWGSLRLASVQFICSPTLCNPMDCSTPGLPVHHQLPEFTQTHVRWVGDAIQPSHPLSSPPPPVFNPSQHQGLFRWVSSSRQVATVLDTLFTYQHLIYFLISYLLITVSSAPGT